jgi:hypothetical protein
MLYNNAQYVSAGNTTIRTSNEGYTIFVPCDMGNRHYVEIMAQVASGNLQIEPYVKAPAPSTPALSLADLFAQIQALQSEIEVLKAG